MDKKTEKEIKDLKEILNNWKRGFISWATPDGGNEFIIEEFLEEIHQQLFPHVNRLFEMKHLTLEEAKDFRDYCFNEVNNLAKLIC